MKKLRNREIASFCEELAWLMHSGVNMGDGLRLMAEEASEETMKACLVQMAGNAETGKTMAEVIEEAACFPVYVQGSIEVGEKTGRTEEALKALAFYYEERERMNRRLRSALLYPSFLVLLLLLVLGVLLTQVLPTFQTVYESLGGKMTGAAGVLLEFGMALKAVLPVIYVLFGIAVTAVFLFSVCEPFRERAISVWKRSMGDRGVLRKVNDAILAHAISMGLSSGMMLEETMELAADVMADVPKAKARCMRCKEDLEKGTPLVEALRDSEILPPTACRLLAVGMQGGNGDTVMEELAKKLFEEADTALARRVERVEPMLVLVTSVLVGVVLLLVMLPLINIMETIG